MGPERHEVDPSGAGAFYARGFAISRSLPDHVGAHPPIVPLEPEHYRARDTPRYACGGASSRITAHKNPIHSRATATAAI